MIVLTHPLHELLAEQNYLVGDKIPVLLIFPSDFLRSHGFDEHGDLMMVCKNNKMNGTFKYANHNKSQLGVSKFFQLFFIHWNYQ